MKNHLHHVNLNSSPAQNHAIDHYNPYDIFHLIFENLDSIINTADITSQHLYNGLPEEKLTIHHLLTPNSQYSQLSTSKTSLATSLLSQLLFSNHILQLDSLNQNITDIEQQLKFEIEQQN
jgi:hypothetical protein